MSSSNNTRTIKINTIDFLKFLKGEASEFKKINLHEYIFRIKLDGQSVSIETNKF